MKEDVIDEIKDLGYSASQAEDIFESIEHFLDTEVNDSRVVELLKQTLVHLKAKHKGMLSDTVERVELGILIYKIEEFIN